MTQVDSSAHCIVGSRDPVSPGNTPTIFATEGNCRQTATARSDSSPLTSGAHWNRLAHRQEASHQGN